MYVPCGDLFLGSSATLPECGMLPSLWFSFFFSVLPLLLPFFVYSVISLLNLGAWRKTKEREIRGVRMWFV